MTDHILDDNRGKMNTPNGKAAWRDATPDDVRKLWNQGLTGTEIAARSSAIPVRSRKPNPTPVTEQNATAVAVQSDPVRLRRAPVQHFGFVPKIVPRPQPVTSMFDQAGTKPDDASTRTHSARLPAIPAERVHARREIEARTDEFRMAGVLRCACGAPGTPHCAKHKRLLISEGAL